MISSKASNTILYKFRSSTNFESVELPGTSARLFDIKRAIVKAKNLDRGVGSAAPQLEFDLSVKNALTEEEYKDESMLIPRGTRLVIQRLPAAKGYGLLARIARADAGMSTPASNVNTNSSAFKAPTGYFTIQSRAGEEDEFIDTKKDSVDYSSQTVPQAVASLQNDPESDEKEMAALKAVTDQAANIFKSQTSLNRFIAPNKFGTTAPVVAGAPRPTINTAYGAVNVFPVAKFSTDPELKELEMKQAQTKKRATGIPRTFLTMGGTEANAVESVIDGEKDSSTIRLQPNNVGFEALIQRGGGVSESGGAQSRSLEYALKVTATTIPEHLKCGICQGVVKNAMLVPWDMEGRAVCEICMRDSLAKNGFKCPLTGIDGVSPDDLHPNYGLRKAADLFVQGVISLMDDIILKQQANEEEELKRGKEHLSSNDSHRDVDEVDLDESGLATRRNRTSNQTKRKRHDLLDLDADFGGDVFAVAKDVTSVDDGLQSSTKADPGLIQAEKVAFDNVNGDDRFDEKVDNNVVTVKNKLLPNDSDNNDLQKDEHAESATRSDQAAATMDETLIANKQSSLDSVVECSPLITKDDRSPDRNDGSSFLIEGSDKTDHLPPNENKNSTASIIDRRELIKSRAPPPGYKMGPAGFPTSPPPPPMMATTRSFQQSPASNNALMQNTLRSEEHNVNRSESYRGRGHSAGRNFLGGRAFRGGHHPSNPQVFNEMTNPSIDMNQASSMDPGGQLNFNSIDERTLRNPEDFQDSPFRESPSAFVPRGRGRSFDPRGGRGRGRDMPPDHWHDAGRGRFGRGHDMMGRGWTYEPQGRFPDHVGRGYGRGMHPGGWGRGPGRGRY